MARAAAALFALALCGCSYPELVRDGAVDAEYLERIAAETAALRELPLERPIPHRLITLEQARAQLQASVAAQDRAALAAEAKALVAFGLAPPGFDLPALLVDLQTEQAAGFYDTAEETLFLVDRELPGASSAWFLSWLLERDVVGELTASHELVHALQDRRYDLDAFLEGSGEPAPLGADARLARRALVEGDATYWSFRFVLRGLSATPDDLELPREELLAGTEGEAFTRSPRAIQEALLFPYVDGLKFMQRVAVLGERLWEQPPASTEQVLHPDRYIRGDLPLTVSLLSAPPEGWDVVREETLGELGLFTILAHTELEPEPRARAAEGWGGDRYWVLERRADGALAVVWALELDRTRDADELERPLGRALAALPGRAHRLERLGDRALAVAIAPDPGLALELIPLARERRVTPAPVRPRAVEGR